MILIADKSSTKTSCDYSLGEVHSENISTNATNPFFSEQAKNILMNFKKKYL
jgi:hypothetical protein